MLTYFKVGNFKSVKEPIAINFEATSITEHEESNVIQKGKDHLLKTLLLYGPNAGGKSKIIDAFVTYRRLVLSSTARHSTSELPMEPFLLNAETAKQPTLFEAEIIIGNEKYRYGFEAYKTHIHKEWLLSVKVKTVKKVFLRIGQRFDIDFNSFENAESLENKCSENVLFLSVADQWNVQLAKKIYRWFFETRHIGGIDTLSGNSGKNRRTSALFQSPEYRSIINQMMRHADLGIQGLNVVRENVEPTVITIEGKIYKYKRDDYTVSAIHNVFDDAGNVVAKEAFSMDERESDGTRKFYNILGYILEAVKKGQLLIIDEIDARFHTLLTKAIIKLFNSEAVKTGAQLLAVCHDAAVMDNDLLRRDQIYIVEKDNYAATKIVNLVEYKSARKETPLAKNYLEGRYGGIPSIENLENFLNNGEE